MARTVYTLDLNFLERQDAIAAYLIPHSEGAVLIESGPGSTIDAIPLNWLFPLVNGANFDNAG